MKINIFFLGILFFMINSCKKEPEYIPEAPYNQVVTANKNGAKWKAYGSAAYEQKKRWLSINGTVYNQYGENRQSFYISKIPFKVGSYLMKVGTDHYTDDGFLYSNFHTLGSDGDVLIDSYYLDDAKIKDCIVKVEKVDSVTRRISGTFQVYLKIKTPKLDKDNPDKLSFEKGVFDFIINP